MGIEHAHGGRRLAPAIVLTTLMLLAAIAVSASLVTANANALPTFTDPVGGIGPCQTCHTKDATHSGTGHVANGVYKLSDLTTCANCHPNGDTTVPPTPAKCATCHGGTTAILAKPTHTTTGCGTTAGCHGYSNPAGVATTVALKVAPTSIKPKKTVKATGTVTPVATLAGVKVAVKAEMKKGAKWVKAKAASAVVSATGDYTWTYKPAKKGSYRMTASIVATSTYGASTSKVKTFKVK